MKYKLPKGTPINRQNRNPMYNSVVGWEEGFVTTKDAYYTDADMERGNEHWTMFFIPETNGFYRIEVRTDDLQIE